MSRALSVLEEFAAPSSINREALMLDEGKVFNQWWEDGDEGGTGKLADYVGLPFIDSRTGFEGILKTRVDRRMGPVYWLSTKEGRAQNLTAGSLVFDPRTRQSLTIGAGGVFTSQKLSEGDIDRMFPGYGGTGGGGGGGGSTGYAAPQWRPGEQAQVERGLDIDQQSVDQRLEEIAAQGKLDADAATAAHDRAMAILQKQLDSAEGMQREQIQADIDLENLRHKNDMKELAIRIAADQKNLVFSEGMARGNVMIQEQGATGRELLGLGADPFAQAAGVSGGVTRGITPQAQAVGQAKSFMNQPVPQMDMNMTTEQMMAALSGMQTQAPMAGGFGMAGTIGMARGGSVKSKKPQSVIVGEAGKEIVTGSDFKVTPLTGTAQFGARIGGVGTDRGSSELITVPRRPPELITVPRRPPPTPSPGGGGRRGIYPQPPPPPPVWDPDWMPGNIQSILQNLSPMYSGSVFGQVPQAAGYGGRWTGLSSIEEPAPPDPYAPISLRPGGGSPLDILGELGIAPQLIRTPSGNTYYIQNGKRYYIKGGQGSQNLMRLNLNPNQVVMVSDADLGRYPPGGVYTGTGTQAAGAVSGTDPSSYGAFGSPLIEPTSGALLMNPKDIAANWWDMSSDQKDLILGAYKAAGGAFSNTGFGLSGNTVQDIIQTFTPAGRGYGRRIGGMGTQY